MYLKTCSYVDNFINVVSFFFFFFTNNLNFLSFIRSADEDCEVQLEALELKAIKFCQPTISKDKNELPRGI